MPTFKLVIAYDGTNYRGWQEQPGLPTIEGLFKQRLKKIFNKEIAFTGASRTDAGVHAQGQVARCILDVPLMADHIKSMLNDRLPEDVQVQSVIEVPDEFHPRKNVQEKTYYYYFFTEPPRPHVSRFGYHVKNLDIERFKEALTYFQGTHDFRSFCTGDQGRTTVRTITALELTSFDHLNIHQVRISGPSFLQHMIRRILGACFDRASSPKKSLSVLQEALEQKDPRQQLYVAPAKGLLLHSIIYTDSAL